MAPDQDVRLLAAQLETYWVEIGRFFLSRRARSRLQKGVAAEMSPIQLQAVDSLADGPLRVGELAERLGLAESSVSRLVDRLTALGLTARRPLAADRRVVEVELTKGGRSIVAAVARRRRDYLIDILNALEPDEREELVRLFSKVVAVQAEQETDQRTSTRIERSS
ncbi:MAG TPA: MarR family transcriptional regulator [Actinomycetota bacterium]|nr:MarR family transcriptional regulator [Actinomycetota bacterium]